MLINKSDCISSENVKIVNLFYYIAQKLERGEFACSYPALANNRSIYIFIWERAGDTGLKLNRNNVNFAPLSIETSFPPVANITVLECSVCKAVVHVCPSHSNCESQSTTDATCHKKRKAKQKKEKTYTQTTVRISCPL